MPKMSDKCGLLQNACNRFLKNTGGPSNDGPPMFFPAWAPASATYGFKATLHERVILPADQQSRPEIQRY